MFGCWWTKTWRKVLLFLLFSWRVMSDCLWPHGLQHTRLPCLPLSHEICSNSCSLIRSVILFNHFILRCPQFLCLQYFPISWFFTSGWHNIGTSTSASVLLINIQGWVPLGLTGLISLLSKRLLESSPTSQFKSINFWHSVFFMVQLSLLYLTTRKTVALTLGTFVSRMSAF